jgi:tetratricopeptide (TPR) repeat protein
MRLTDQPQADLYYDLGKSLFMLGLSDRALAVFEKMVRSYPLDARGYEEESHTLDRLNRRPEAARALEAGLGAITPNDVAGRIQIIDQFDADGDTARAYKEADSLRSRMPGNVPATLDVVRLLIKMQQPADARQLLLDLLAKDPANSQAHFAMGALLSNAALPERDTAAAENEMLLAVRSARDNPTFYSGLGELYMDQRKYRQCAYVSIQLLLGVPDSAAARLKLATCYAHLGNPTAASEQNAITVRLLARDAEEGSLETIAMAHPNAPDSHLTLAHHAIKFGRYAEALPELEAARVLAPQDASIKRELDGLCGMIGIEPPTLPTLDRP